MVFFNNGLSAVEPEDHYPISNEIRKFKPQFIELIEKMGIEKEKSEKFFLMGCHQDVAGGYLNWISINQLFFVDWNSLPIELKINKSTDERLGNLNFVKKIFDFLLKKESPEKVNYNHVLCKILILKLQEKTPELARSAFDFIIGHELGHLYHKHLLRGDSFELRAKIITILFIGIFSLTVCLNSLHAIIFKISAIVLVGLGAYWLTTTLNERRDEFEADAFAASRLKDCREGAEHLFQCMRETKLLTIEHALRDKNFFPRQILRFKILMSSLLDPHPGLDSRIKYIRKIASNSFVV